MLRSNHLTIKYIIFLIFADTRQKARKKTKRKGEHPWSALESSEGQASEYRKAKRRKKTQVVKYSSSSSESRRNSDDEGPINIPVTPFNFENPYPVTDFTARSPTVPSDTEEQEVN